uniref:Plus3 domain-containing protein n=1 Tax=Globisporangium ultimum (strain ATCC 200006 / CBS 805.95 / DAOM BR144) TaxID=431595 RepID=K3W5X8_GLOUD
MAPAKKNRVIDDSGESDGGNSSASGSIEDEEDSEAELEFEQNLDGLTEVEKEKRLLEKYEADEQKNKEKDLKKRLAASQGKPSKENEESEESDEVVSTRRGGRSRESDRRKEALKSLKNTKSKGSGEKARSMLVDRFGDDDGSDAEVGGGAGRDLAEKRRKRQELQRGSRGRGRDGDDDDYSDDDDNENDRRKKPEQRSGSGIKSALPVSLDGGRVDEEDELKPEENVPVNWNQANHYLLQKRTFFEKYFFEPYFEKLVKGVYVRIPISVVDGEMVYRFCEVVNTCRLQKAYTFMGESTHTGVVCAFGKSRLEWKLNGLSTHSLKEREFLVWRATLNKERLHFPTHAEAKKLYRDKQRMVLKHQYTDEEVNVMVNRKKDIGQSTVSLGVQRVRLERDLRAAQDMKNFDKALKLEEKLRKLLDENEARQNRKTDDVLRINEINKRNREANQKQDLQAQLLNDASLEKMTSAERLQFVRANSKKMFLSRSILERNLADGKLIQLPDGRIMTLNKVHEVEALPDDLVAGVSGATKSSKSGNSLEIDIEKLLEKQRERKLKESQKVEEMLKEKDSKVEFVGGAAPTNVQERANSTIRIQDSDGSWMTLRPANEIVKQMQTKPVVSAETKATRKGITVKEYFDRVKRRRVNE